MKDKVPARRLLTGTSQDGCQIRKEESSAWCASLAEKEKDFTKAAQFSTKIRDEHQASE
jgi:hypothetical protein